MYRHLRSKWRLRTHALPLHAVQGIVGLERLLACMHACMHIGAHATVQIPNSASHARMVEFGAGLLGASPLEGDRARETDIQESSKTLKEEGV